MRDLLKFSSIIIIIVGLTMGPLFLVFFIDHKRWEAKIKVCEQKALAFSNQYKTRHKLLRLAREERGVKESTARAELHGSFFVVLGDINGKWEAGKETTYNETFLRFAWDRGDGVYVTSTLPLAKVNIALAQDVALSVSFDMRFPALLCAGGDKSPDRVYGEENLHLAQYLVSATLFVPPDIWEEEAGVLW